MLISPRGRSAAALAAWQWDFHRHRRHDACRLPALPATPRHPERGRARTRSCVPWLGTTAASCPEKEEGETIHHADVQELAGEDGQPRARSGGMRPNDYGTAKNIFEISFVFSFTLWEIHPFFLVYLSIFQAYSFGVFPFVFFYPFKLS